jgi:peptide deformylase
MVSSNMSEQHSEATHGHPAVVQGRPADDLPIPAPHSRRGKARRITVIGEEILHRPCQAVTEFGTPELASLIDDMFRTMYVASGVGLAANQVGVDLRLFVYDCPDDNGVRHVGHVINPVVDEQEPNVRLETMLEGCLSVPGPVVALPRPGRTVVRGVDLDGRPLVIEGTGFFARCLQHETDHLNGHLYLDLLGASERDEALRQMEAMRDEVFASREVRAALLDGRPVSISLATPSDLDTVATLLRAVDLHYHEQAEPVKAYMAVAASALDPRADCEVALATVDGQPVGLATFAVVYPGSPLAGLMFMKELFVLAPFRGLGIGRQLIGYLAAVARERGCRRMAWTAERDNPRAMAFYQGLGAKAVPEKVYFRVEGEALERLEAYRRA